MTKKYDITELAEFLKVSRFRLLRAMRNEFSVFTPAYLDAGKGAPKRIWSHEQAQKMREALKLKPFPSPGRPRLQRAQS